MIIRKKPDNFIIYFAVLLFFILTLFVLSVDLKFFYSYGIEEKAIFFGRSFDISSNNGTSELPQISSQGNNVYVVWQDNTTGNYDIFFKPSLTNGTKFKSIRNLSNNNGTSQLPQITAQGTNVYIVWQDNTNGNDDIFFKRSPNGGTGFRSVNIMNSNGTSEQPKLAAQGDNVYVVWQDNKTGNYDIYFQPFNSNGTKFKSVRNLSNNNGISQLPHVAALPNDIYVIWKDDDSGTGRIFFKHVQIDNSTGTLKLGSVNKLSHNGDVSQPKLAGGSEFFYGVWSTHLNKNNASIIEFYPFMLFEDYSGDAIPLTSLSSKEILVNPDIAVDENDTYLVWENETVGNGDIFFKKLSTNFFDRN